MKLIKKDYENGYHDNIFYREMRNAPRNRSRLSVLLREKKEGHLLEIGCGEGGFLRLAEKHFQVEGVDVSNHAIETIRPYFGERVRAGNIEMDPLPTGRYDVVIVFNILEHLRQPLQALEKISNALTTNGVIVGSVPNNFGPIGGVVTRVGNFFDRTHVSTYPPHTWRQLFKQSGFTRVDFFGEVTFGRNHCQYLRHRLWPYLSFNLMFVCEKADAIA